MHAVSALTCSLQTMEQEMLHVNKSCIACSNTAHCDKIHKVEKFTLTSLILIASIFTAKYFKEKEEENEKKEPHI